MSEAWIIDAVRTPRGRGKAGKGALSNDHPQELLAQSLNALRERNGSTTSDVEDVVAGCVSRSTSRARASRATPCSTPGWPDDVTGVTLNRFCGSGLQAVNFAAMGVMAGQQELVIGGGVESMSRVPMGSDGGGLDGHNPQLAAHAPDGAAGHLGRPDRDARGLHARATSTRSRREPATHASARRRRGASTRACRRAQPRRARSRSTATSTRAPTPRARALAKLKPAFAELGAYKPEGPTRTLDRARALALPAAKKIEHVHNAGQLVGHRRRRGAVLLASADYAKAHGLKPRARIRAMATAAPSRSSC